MNQKLPKGKLTIDKLLSKDDVWDCINDVKERLVSAKDVMVVWVDSKNICHYSYAGETPRILYALENAKLALFSVAHQED
jgi:hypothetical protein